MRVNSYVTFWMSKHEAWCPVCFSGFENNDPQITLLFQHPWILFQSLLSVHTKNCQIWQVTCFFFLWKWYVADITILQRIWVRKMGSCPIGATSPCSWTTCLCSWAPTPLVDSLVILSLSPLGKCKNYWLLKGRVSSKLASSQVKKRKWEGFEEAPLCVHHLRVKNWDLLIHYLFAKNLVNEWGELSIRGKCGE